MTLCTSGKEPKTIGRNDAIPPSLPSRMNLEAGGSFAELLLLSFGQKGYEASRDQAADGTRTKRTSNGFVPRTKTTTGLAFRTRGGLPRHDLTWKPNQSLIKPRALAAFSAETPTRRHPPGCTSVYCGRWLPSSSALSEAFSAPTRIRLLIYGFISKDKSWLLFVS